MPFALTIALRDGRTCTTESPALSNLTNAGLFIASMASESPDAQFTISATHGPDIVGRYGDIASVLVEVQP